MRANCWLIAGAVVVGVYFLIEHPAHVAQYWPLLLVLACPLMHLFHRGQHS
jgi:hypothetical protein